VEGPKLFLNDSGEPHGTIEVRRAPATEEIEWLLDRGACKDFRNIIVADSERINRREEHPRSVPVHHQPSRWGEAVRIASAWDHDYRL